MNHHNLTCSFASLLLGCSIAAQGNFLLTYSQAELTVSGSGGTVLQQLNPNEIAYLDFSGPCSAVSAEKWAPRTCFHAMGGDADGDACYWDPAIFATVDALLAGQSASPVGGGNQRTTFWSPSVALGTAISGAPGLRPGDVGRLVRNTSGDGQVEYFMTREQFNTALGLPLTTAIDVDAIAFAPGMGVYFSLDQDVNAITQCGPMLIRDGAIICVPQTLMTYTSDLRIATVAPMSAFRLFSEADMDNIVFTARAKDRVGNCILQAIDVEALEIDYSSAPFAIPGCQGTVIYVPTLLFATETTTGAGLLSTAGGGQIYVGPCGPAATSCTSLLPTYGPQMGIQATSTTLGAPSHINAIASTSVCRYVLEPQQHVLTVFPFGAPVGSTAIDVGSPWLWNFMFVTFVPPTVPTSASFAPFSLFCFPDYYPTNIYWSPVTAPGGWGSIPMFAIPPNVTGHVLFQSLAFGGSGLELSTPAIIDVK